MSERLQLWTAWAYVYGALPLAWASVVLHGRTPWRSTELGRHLFTYALIVAVILTFGAIRYFHAGALPAWLEVVRFAAYIAFIPTMGWRVLLQVRAAARR